METKENRASENRKKIQGKLSLNVNVVRLFRRYRRRTWPRPSLHTKHTTATNLLDPNDLPNRTRTQAHTRFKIMSISCTMFTAKRPHASSNSHLWILQNTNSNARNRSESNVSREIYVRLIDTMLSPARLQHQVSSDVNNKTCCWRRRQVSANARKEQKFRQTVR